MHLLWEIILNVLCIKISFGLNKDSPNVCPKIISISKGSIYQQQLVIKCCPDYYKINGTCKVCEAGTYGKDCLYPCPTNHYGTQCRYTCNCTANKICDPVHGCICSAGLTGATCSEDCPPGKYGVNCNKTCLCANGASCNQYTDQCICLPGWQGDHCTHECPRGYYGQDCKEKCTCPVYAECDVVTGECKCHTESAVVECPITAEYKADSTGVVITYIIMTTSIVFLIFTVTLVVKAKQWVLRSDLWKKKKKQYTRQSNDEIKNRPAIHQPTDLSVVYTSETGCGQLPKENNIYFEIGDVIDTNN